MIILYWFINKWIKLCNIDVILSNIQVICRDCFANCRISNILHPACVGSEKDRIDELKTLLVNLIRPVMDENNTLLTISGISRRWKKRRKSLRVMEGLRAGYPRPASPWPPRGHLSHRFDHRRDYSRRYPGQHFFKLLHWKMMTSRAQMKACFRFA